MLDISQILRNMKNILYNKILIKTKIYFLNIYRIRLNNSLKLKMNILISSNNFSSNIKSLKLCNKSQNYY